MPTTVTCPNCGTAASAGGDAAGASVTCIGCGAAVPASKPPVAIPVSKPPAAIPVAGVPKRPTRPPAPADANAGRGMPTWVRYGLWVGAFVVICVIFAFIGAASNPDEPGLAGSRMARKVGAPLALLLIRAVELVLWLIRRQSPKGK
jgi:hypothetical protein